MNERSPFALVGPAIITLVLGFVVAVAWSFITNQRAAIMESFPEEVQLVAKNFEPIAISIIALAIILLAMRSK